MWIEPPDLIRPPFGKENLAVGEDNRMERLAPGDDERRSPGFSPGMIVFTQPGMAHSVIVRVSGGGATAAVSNNARSTNWDNANNTKVTRPRFNLLLMNNYLHTGGNFISPNMTKTKQRGLAKQFLGEEPE